MTLARKMCTDRGMSESQEENGQLIFFLKREDSNVAPGRSFCFWGLSLVISFGPPLLLDGATPQRGRDIFGSIITVLKCLVASSIDVYSVM